MSAQQEGAFRTSSLDEVLDEPSGHHPQLIVPLGHDFFL
jgi:hypothetical protein